MARLEYKHREMSENIIVKVKPVDIPLSTVGWQFGGIRWKDATEEGLEGDSEWRYPPDEKRKVMKVMYADPGLQKGLDGKTFTFLIDVPKHFFDKETGEFTAEPAYNTNDTLHVLWTGGLGLGSGWIDLNYQERGGNGGGGGSNTTEIGCAKWS